MNKSVEKMNHIFNTLLSILVAFFVGGILLVIIGYEPLSVYKTILKGAFGSNYSIAKTLAKATPLILTGLSVFIAGKCGLFNIGSEGQLLVGGLSAGYLGFVFSEIGFSGPFAVLLLIIISGIVGGLWGMLPGYFKATRNSNEFIVSMMLNYVAKFLCIYLVTYPMRDTSSVLSKTPDLISELQLNKLVPGTQLNLGLIIGFIAILLTYWYFNNSISGFEMRMLGKNKYVAEAAGVNVKNKIILAFFISGFCAGLAGAIEVMGVHSYFLADLSPGYGYDGIAVSVLAQGSSFGVGLSAILFGALRAGGSYLDFKTSLPYEFVIILQALVIVLIALPYELKIIKLKNEKLGKKVKKRSLQDA
jgi:simple sugar transport system permease protein